MRMLTGHVVAQPLWEFLHRVSLLGMNVGMGSSVGDSGERAGNGRAMGGAEDTAVNHFWRGIASTPSRHYPWANRGYRTGGRRSRIHPHHFPRCGAHQ